MAGSSSLEAVVVVVVESSTPFPSYGATVSESNTAAATADLEEAATTASDESSDAAAREDGEYQHLIVILPEETDGTKDYSSKDSIINDTENDTTIDDQKEQQGKASPLNEVINLSKNMIGSGVLSLSGGMALYSNSPRASVSGAILIAFMGAFSGYFCLLIARICEMTNTTTYKGAWENVMVGTSSRWANFVAIINFLNPAILNLGYSTILSQTFQSLFRAVGLPGVTRIQSLVLVTLFGLLPLCLLKNLYILAPCSAVGTASVIVTAILMLIRCLDGSYQPGGLYYNDILAVGSESISFMADSSNNHNEEEVVALSSFFGDRDQLWSLHVLPFVCMLLEGFVMHYNAPRFYHELADATIPRFGGVVVASFLLTTAIYIAIALAGYLTFGGTCDGYILNNYSDFDSLMNAGRILIALATLVTFPLAFIGFRDGVLDILNFPRDWHSDRNLNILTVILLTLITLTACFVTDLGMINAVGGGSLAAAIVCVFPTLMFDKAVQGKESIQLALQIEVAFARVLMALGVFVGLAGTWMALAATTG